MVCCDFFSFTPSARSDWGAQAAWDVAVQELNSVASGSKDRKVTHKIPTTYYRDERRTSAHLRQELPPSIELPLPPGGEMPLPQKTSQRVEQMNRRPMFREYVYVPSTTLARILNLAQTTGGPGDRER